jgi:hypothetical protein
MKEIAKLLGILTLAAMPGGLIILGILFLNTKKKDNKNVKIDSTTN